MQQPNNSVRITLSGNRLQNILKGLFDEASAGDYLEAINHFVRQKVEDADKEDCSQLFNIMKLTQVLASMEREYHLQELHHN